MPLDAAGTDFDITSGLKEFEFKKDGAPVERVDVFSMSNPFMLKNDYKKHAQRIGQLDKSEQKLLQDVADWTATPASKRGFSPLEPNDAQQKLRVAGFLHHTKVIGLDPLDHDVHAVLDDMRPSLYGDKKTEKGPGYSSKIFEIRGRPVSERVLKQDLSTRRSLEAGWADPKLYQRQQSRANLRQVTSAAATEPSPQLATNAAPPPLATNAPHAPPRGGGPVQQRLAAFKP